jgi:hypothetical protein
VSVNNAIKRSTMFGIHIQFTAGLKAFENCLCKFSKESIKIAWL